MNITLSVDEQVVERAKESLRAIGKSINEEIRDHLRSVAGVDDAKGDVEEFKRLSGLGDSKGWKFNRDELHERR
jgi:hypothetical protein